MDRSLELGNRLREFLGNSNVYFQPPESIRLHYPCIIYKRSSGSTRYANDMPYNFHQSYELMLITEEPDSSLIEDLAMAFPTIKYGRHFTKNNLNHYAYSIYY